MIGRVFRGAAVHGLLRYLFAAGSSAGRGNVHVDPRLIAAWDGSPAAHAPAPGNGGTARVGPLAAVLTAPLAGCAGAPDKYVYHLMLRNHHGDRDLSDAEWARLAAGAMAAVGIAPADDPGGCRWVAVRHDDSHIHVVATLAREDGATVNLWRDFLRLRAFCRQVEQRLGLTATAGADQTAAPRAGVREQVTAERTGRAEPARDTLRRVVATAAAGSATPAEFREFLTGRGVEVRFRHAADDAQRIVGASYGLGGHRTAAGAQIWFGGARLAPDLSWPKLRARWRRRAGGEPTDEWVAAARRAGARRDPRSAADGDAAWAQAVRVAELAARRIRAAARVDPDRAADSAWAAADLLASVAFTVEGGRGGPLTGAADELGRAGRDLYRRVPRRTDGGVGLRAAARVVTALAAASGRPDPQLQALLVALAGVARAVEDLRTAQQRTHQAGAARAGAERLLAAPPARRDPTRPGSAHPAGPVPFDPVRRRRTTVHVGGAPDVPPADDVGNRHDDPAAGLEL